MLDWPDRRLVSMHASLAGNPLARTGRPLHPSFTGQVLQPHVRVNLVIMRRHPPTAPDKDVVWVRA